MEKRNILLFVPNLIGYIRILLILLSFAGYDHPTWFLVLYITSVLLDWLDGIAARQLNQCSEYGAWLDVVVDLLGRGWLWCRLYQMGYVVICVEWLTFVATHCRGPEWKIPEDRFPWLVIRVMENGFKTVWGVVALYSLHALPIWLYAFHSNVLSDFLLPPWLQLTGVAALTGGRMLCLYVELFYIYNHIDKLLQNSVAARKDVRKD